MRKAINVNCTTETRNKLYVQFYCTQEYFLTITEKSSGTMVSSGKTIATEGFLGKEKKKRSPGRI